MLLGEGFLSLVALVFYSLSSRTKVFISFQAKDMKAVSMLTFSLALVQKNLQLYLKQNFYASQQDTFLYFQGRSHLLPMISFETFLSENQSTCLIQFWMFQKERRSEMEYMRITPWAPLQQVVVMFWNRSWPAVSQMVILSLRFPTLSILTLKSTPIVAVCTVRYFYSVNLRRTLDFPTAESPIMMILTMQSQLFIWCGFIEFLILKSLVQKFYQQFWFYLFFALIY